MKELVDSSKGFWDKFIKDKTGLIVIFLAVGLFLFNSETFSLPYISKFFGKIFSSNPNNYENLLDNFYEIEKDTFYRSKQLYHKRLNYYLKRFKIKTVINLRGINSDKKWWQKEREVIEKNNAKMYNIAMSARRFPTEEEIDQLLFLYKNSEKPILIHCYAGADRTGEAAAIWVLSQQHKSKKEAMRQLSHKFGHIQFFYPKKRQFIRLFVSSRNN